MKDWRKATNKNIPVLSYHFFFHESKARELNLSKSFYLPLLFCYPCFQKIVLFSRVLISSQTLTILPLPWFLWRPNVRIYEGKPVSKPRNSVLTCPFFSDNLCLLSLVKNSCFSNTTKHQIYLFCCVARIHHHIQLNNCTKPVVNKHLCWTRFHEAPKPLCQYQLHEGLAAAARSTVCDQGQGHRLSMGEEERAFPCIAHSHWVFLIVLLLSKQEHQWWKDLYKPWMNSGHRNSSVSS